VSTRDLPPEAFSDAFPPSIGRPANAALVARGITTLEQVANLTSRELGELHGVGPKALRLLAEALQSRGLSFRSEAED
jgi:DNA-directed RNA polymerase alpha subunit